MKSPKNSLELFYFVCKEMKSLVNGNLSYQEANALAALARQANNAIANRRMDKALILNEQIRKEAKKEKKAKE